jgi:pyruvate/2-oxoglutarate dehydrogenase complex dihydrolipoamide acyltransferase (E2) component
MVTKAQMKEMLAEMAHETGVKLETLTNIAIKHGYKPKDNFASKEARELAHKHGLKDTDIKSTRDDGRIGVDCVRAHLGIKTSTKGTGFSVEARRMVEAMPEPKLTPEDFPEEKRSGRYLKTLKCKMIKKEDVIKVAQEKGLKLQ